MKQYIITCKEVNGIKGKRLTEGNIYADTEFNIGAVEALLISGHIEESKGIEHIVTAEDMQYNPEIKDQGVSVGEVIEISETVNPNELDAE